MPFGCRNIEPSRLGAHEVPQDEEFNRKSVLSTVANNAIVGALLQLSSLVRHADDLFCDISDECQKVVERTEKITKRIQGLSTVASKLDAKQAKIRNLKHLSYRDEKNTDHNCITDVYDGELYKKHMKDGGFLQDNNNISLLGNTDGVAVFKSSSFSVWPVYVVVNELPPKIRFRKENRILCGLWFGKKKPNFTTFFKPFTETVWNLFTDGFQITDPVNKEMKTVKAILLHMTCDSPAKCIFQDFMQYNAYFGCPYCLDPGAYDKEGRSHVYPFSVESENGFGVERTHESTVVYAQEARVNLAQGKKKFAVKGVKGFSWAFSLPRFDIINSMCLDYMHAVLLGVMKQLLQLWCRSSKEMYTLSNADYSIVQKRLQEIQPPNNITRVPRSLDEQKHWKASEYRSFLLFYGAACLYGVLDQVYFDHFMLLSDAIWLLLQECITKQELEQATSKLQYFCFQMATLYGSRSSTFSVHLLLHIPTSVRYNGPLWCNSCFFFEDQNGELRQYFHSSQHPDSQVVRAASIVQTLPKMAEKMESGSPADFLYRSITVDRYKVKCDGKVDTDGTAFLGQPEEIRENVLHNTGLSYKFKRALVNGEVFHSVQYLKSSKPEGDLKQFTTITNHHQARHGYDASLFLQTNRPQCVQDLYNLCAPNPTRVIRSADLYRKDGLSGSKMFKCWPVIMNEQTVKTPDLNLPRRVQRVRSFEKKYKTLKIRERPKTIHGWDDFTLEDSKNEITEEKNKKTECLTSPEPPVVVSIDTSGSNFERMQSMRSSGRRYQSKEEREKKKRRRRTVSGVENIMSEIEKFERKHKNNEGGPRSTPRSYSFDDLDAEDDIERDEGMMKYLDEIDGKMEERIGEEKAQKIMKFFPCRRTRSLPRCIKLSSVTRSLSADRRSQRDFNTSYGSSTLSIASMASNASSRLSRSAKRSSIIGNKIKSLVTNAKDKPKPRPKSLDIDTFLDTKVTARSSIEEQDRSKSTYSLERNHNHSVPDNLLSKGHADSSSSTVGPGSYYNFESSTLPRAQAKKYDFPWESLPKDWTTSVKLREISKRRAKEDRQSSSGNWSQSGTSSNRHSLDSDLRSEGFKFTSQYSLGKDSGRDSLTLEEENDCVTDGTSTAGYAADSQSTVTGDSISIGNPKSDFTQLDTEAWIQSLAVRAAKREEAESKDKSSTLSKLTRQNILALDLMLAEGQPKALGDEECSVYSVDQEGFYTSFHNDSGLKKSTNTLVDEEDIDFSPTKDSASVCSAESVIHRPFGDSDKFAGLRKNSHTKVLSKVIPPTPPVRTSSQKSTGEVTFLKTPELHSFPSQDSTVSESDAEAVFTRVHDKTNLSSTGFPSLVALSTSDDESSPESRNIRNKEKGLSETVSELGLSDLRETSGFSYLSFQTGSSLDSSKSDNSFSSLKHSKSALECTDQGYDSLTLPRSKETGSTKSAVGYQSWPRSHKNNPTSGILKTPEKQFDGVRPQKTLNFAPIVNLFREGAENSVQMPLPSPTSSSSSETNNGPFMSSFQTPPSQDQSYILSIPIENSKNSQGNKSQSGIPSKYQPVITVTPRSRSKSGDRLSQGSDRRSQRSESNKTPESGGRQMIYASTANKPSAQSTPQVPSSQVTEKQTSPSLYAVSPVMAPKDPSRQNSVTSTDSSNSGYMDMQSLKSAESLNSLASSEGLNGNSTYMSMSSPCSSPNLSNMDFSISSTPSGSMDSLLDMRKTPTNELENDTYQVNTSLHMNQYSKNARSRKANGATETVPIVTQHNSRGYNSAQQVDAKQSFGSFRTPDTSYSSSKQMPGRRSLDSTGNDLTNVTQMSFDSTIGTRSTPVTRNSGTPTSRESPTLSGQRQQGRRSRADTRKEPSYRNLNATNRRSLPSDVSTSVQIRNVPLNDTRQGVSSNQSHYKSQNSMSSSNSCPLGFNSVLLSNSSYNSGQNSANSQYMKRQSRTSPTSNSDNGHVSSRSDSYRVALKNKSSEGSGRNAMHQSKSMPMLPPSRKSGPFRVAMDMSPNRAYSNGVDDDVMSRADSYRIAVRNTNGLGTEILNRNTSYRVAVNDEIPSMLNSKLDALGMDDNKLMSGRDVRRMGITDVDQVKDINPKPVIRESKSAVQLRNRDSKPAPQAMGPNSHSLSRPSSQPQQTKNDGRIRQCFKQDVDPIQVVATVDINGESKKSGKNNPNRSSTYIQFDPIFEDTEDFSNAADLDMTSLDYSKNISNISKSKFGLINGTVKDANANTVKMKKSKSGKDIEIEDNWRFSQV